MEKRWYILDCFGTLVEPVTNEWAKLLLKQFADKAERKKLMNILMTTDKSIKEILDTCDGDHITPETKEAIIQLFQNDPTLLYKDAEQFLDNCLIYNIPFVLWSNLSYDYTSQIDALIKKPYRKRDPNILLSEVFYSCETGYKKPQLEWYKLPIQRLQDQWIERESIIMIWDSLKNDYLTPLSLWIQAILLDRKGLNTDPTVKTIRSFDELW